MAPSLFSSARRGFRKHDRKVVFVMLRGLQRDVVYLCWPIAPSYMSPNAGGSWGELRGLSQWVQLYTGAQINFRDLTSWRHRCLFHLIKEQPGRVSDRNKIEKSSMLCIFLPVLWFGESSCKRVAATTATAAAAGIRRLWAGAHEHARKGWAEDARQSHGGGCGGCCQHLPGLLGWTPRLWEKNNAWLSKLFIKKASIYPNGSWPHALPFVHCLPLGGGEKGGGSVVLVHLSPANPQPPNPEPPSPLTMSAHHLQKFIMFTFGDIIYTSLFSRTPRLWKQNGLTDTVDKSRTFPS